MIRRAVVSLLALITIAIATEWCLRLCWGLGNPIFLQLDSSCSYIVKPNQDLYRFGKHFSINQWGMRSADVTKIKRPGTKRLMVIGDSLVFGTNQVDQSDIFTSLLQHDLGWLRVEVMNVSAGGWAPQNEANYLRSRGNMGANLIIEVLNTSDLCQPLASPQQDLLNRPTSAISELLTRYLIPRLKSSRNPIDPGAAQPAKQEACLEPAESTVAALEEMQNSAARGGSPLAILYISFPRVFEQDPVHPVEPLAAPNKLLAWAKTRHIPLTDLSRAEARIPTNNISLSDKTHLNTAGHRLVADVIMQHIMCDPAYNALQRTGN